MVGILEVRGGTEGTEDNDAAVATGIAGATEICGIALGAKLGAVVTEAASSSSWGFSSSEISTLAGGKSAWFCNAIICAVRRRKSFLE